MNGRHSFVCMLSFYSLLWCGRYSARYVCSLVADVHRTLLYGGVAMNPRSHLRLLYEGNPMAFIVEEAGGKGVDGLRNLRTIAPEKLHQKVRSVSFPLSLSLFTLSLSPFALRSEKTRRLSIDATK